MISISHTLLIYIYTPSFLPIWMTGRDGRPSNDAAFLKWRGRHELAHAWYAGSTQHNCGVCKGRCTLDPLGLPRRDTPDWEVSSHQQRKSLCLCTDISLPLYQRDPQIKVAFRSFYTPLNQRCLVFLQQVRVKK